MTPSSSGHAGAAPAVEELVALIPAGNVTTYGEVAKVVGTGARYVGTVMRQSSGLPWWRVVRANGASHDADRARAHWQAEGIAFRGGRADLKRCGLDREDLRHLLAGRA